MNLEKMNEFFTARAEIYDEHMLNGGFGMREAYPEIARYLSLNTAELLDLGCGSGLQLDEIFRLYPDISVTGIDLTQALLNQLKEKYPDKNIKLICGSYFDTDFGKEMFETAISCQTMHHFPKEDKLKLYSRIRESLKTGGRYVECDYMILEQSDEDLYFSEYKRKKAEQGITDNEFYHYDTPCTIENQIKLFLDAGFREARKVFRAESTTIVVAYK